MYDDAASRKSDKLTARGRGWASSSPRSLCGKSVPRKKGRKKSFLLDPGTVNLSFVLPAKSFALNDIADENSG
jgi:hypothetical protein